MRRKRELANCLSFWWVKGGSSRTATSQKERRAASGGANQQNHSIWEGMNKLIVFVVAWSVGWFGLLILCGGLWAAAQPLLRTRRDKPTPNQLKVNCERNERNESKRFVEWKWIYSLEWNKRGIEWSERAPPQGAKCSAASPNKQTQSLLARWSAIKRLICFFVLQLRPYFNSLQFNSQFVFMTLNENKWSWMRWISLFFNN